MKNHNMWIPKIYQTEDTIFHYTKTATALEHILFNKKLRLSDRNDSNDPIENMTPSFSAGLIAGNQEELENIQNITYDDSCKIKDDIKARIQQAKQVCFCMNDLSGKYDREHIKPLEYYGCMKPRMWEQYADNYNGVCLVLSKNKLLELLDDSYVHDKIKYVDYSTLRDNHNRTDLNDLRKKGYESYKKTCFDKIDKVIFRKHVDYSGENEYRICRFVENEIVEINIETALKGIIVSGNNSDYFKDNLKEYAKEYQVKIIEVNWKNTGVEINDPEWFLDLERETKNDYNPNRD